MNFAVVYLAVRFFYRIFDFFHHWYVDGTKRLGHYTANFFERLDKNLALTITVRYFFEPLYKDYTFIGRILGIIFRSGRVALGVVLYAVLGLLFLFVYLVWWGLPLALILYTFFNL